MDTTEKRAAYNSTFAIGGVSCSADTFVINQNLVLRINICGDNPAHRKSAKRYWLVCRNYAEENNLKKNFGSTKFKREA